MFFKKKVLTPFIALLLALVCCGVSILGTWMVTRDGSDQKVQTESTADAGSDSKSESATEVEPASETDLYHQAIADAVVADSDELLPLVEITPDSDMVTWNDAGDKVLMLTLHNYPDSYPAGSDITTQWGYVWTFTDKEFAELFKEESADVTDWDFRIKQILGMPEDNPNSYITAMWVSPDDLIRPAYVTDITKQMTNSFDEEQPESEEYVSWFNSNAVYSYCGETYPWTRLGYTYDWADNSTEYGLSEFLVENGSTVTVEYTKTIDDFIAALG